MGMRYLGGGVGHFTPCPIDNEHEGSSNLESATEHLDEGTHEQFIEPSQATSDDEDDDNFEGELDDEEDLDGEEDEAEYESEFNWEEDYAMEEDVDI